MTLALLLLLLLLLPPPLLLRRAAVPRRTFVLNNRRISAVGQRAGTPVAQPGDVVLVPAEVLLLGPASAPCCALAPARPWRAGAARRVAATHFDLNEQKFWFTTCARDRNQAGGLLGTMH